MPTHDCADAGHAAVNAMREAAGGRPKLRAELTEEDLADAIADVLHLAVALDLDVDEVLWHGRRYFDGDVVETDVHADMGEHPAPPTTEEQIG